MYTAGIFQSSTITKSTNIPNMVQLIKSSTPTSNWTQLIKSSTPTRAIGSLKQLIQSPTSTRAIGPVKNPNLRSFHQPCASVWWLPAALRRPQKNDAPGFIEYVYCKFNHILSI